MGGHKTKGKSCGENPPKAKGKAEKANKAKDKAKDREKRKNHELPTSSHAASDDETSDDEIQPPQRKRIRREPGPPEPSPVPSQAGASPPNMQRPDADEEIDERESTPQQHTNISPPVQQSQHEVASRRMSESATMVNLGRKEYKRFMEGLMSALAKKCPGTAEPPFKGYWTEARYVVRMIGPFDNVEHIIKIGVRLYSDTDVDLNDDELPIDDQHLASFTKPELRHWSALFERILTACTWLPPLLLRLKKHPDNVSPVASFIDRACSSARTDDIGRLKTEVLLHLPRIEGIDAPAPKLKKEDRGWCCPATARMLCPRTERDEFDADPLRFCAEVRNGQRVIDHDDWPTLLYSETEFDENNLDDGALRSGFLLSCWLVVFKGPNSALQDSSSRKGGRRTLAQVYNITRVDKYSICYVVILARFLLSSVREWHPKDGAFSGPEFWKNLMLLFEEKNWCDETLAWWNEKALCVKVPGHRTSTAVIPRAGPSSVSRLQQQRAARLQHRRPSAGTGES